VVPDKVVATDIDETPLQDELPRQAAIRLARAKAAAAATSGVFVLAADTIVAVGRRILPKAATAEQARACLERLSGRRHHVWSAVVVVAPDGRRAERLTDSIVAFARLTSRQMETYVATGEWSGKAGGYAIQGHAAAHIRWLGGSYSAVVGLPLFETAQLLRGLGYPLP